MPAIMLFFSAQILADVEQARLDAVAADLQARIDEGKLSGAVVMVAQDGEVLMHEAMGYQNVEDKVPMSTDTIFRIFSMTKPVTGTALMMLWDEGKFELDDPVEMHLPELAGMRVLVEENDDGSWNTEPAEHPMTIRELMSHTGGLTYFPPLGSGSIADAYVESGIGAEATLAESIPNLANIPLLNQPGAKWVYSISVDVQGYLIERLSGQTLDSFFQERIFEPLGMVDTGFFVPPENHLRLSRMYMPSGERLIRTDSSPEALGGAFTEKPKFLAGGHGLVSTSTDYNEGVLDRVPETRLPDAGHSHGTWHTRLEPGGKLFHISKVGIKPLSDQILIRRVEHQRHRFRMNIVPLRRQRRQGDDRGRVNTLSCLLIAVLLIKPAEGNGCSLQFNHVIGLLITQTLDKSTRRNDTA